MGNIPTIENLPTIESLPIIESLPSIEILPTIESLPTIANLPTIEILPTIESLPTIGNLPTIENLEMPALESERETLESQQDDELVFRKSRLLPTTAPKKKSFFALVKPKILFHRMKPKAMLSKILHHGFWRPLKFVRDSIGGTQPSDPSPSHCSKCKGKGTYKSWWNSYECEPCKGTCSIVTDSVPVGPLGGEREVLSLCELH